MSTSVLEQALRDVVSGEVRRVLRAELTALAAPRDEPRYLPVAVAAARIGVAPATIRVWINQGKIKRYHAGRVFRVRWSELQTLLRSGPKKTERTPEEEADLYLERRRQRRAHETGNTK
jgi:excisionase family DNA binding protein